MNYILANQEEIFISIIISYFLLGFLFTVILNDLTKNKIVKNFGILVGIIICCYVYNYYIESKIGNRELEYLNTLKSLEKYKNNEELNELFKEALIDNKISINEYNQIRRVETKLIHQRYEEIYKEKLNKLKE